MGIYVYQVTKGKPALVNDTIHEIGLLKYYTKPYDIWYDVLGGRSMGYGERIEKKIAKSYRMFFARQKRIPYRRYVVYEFANGQDVYEMDDGLTWAYDTPTIGKGRIGTLKLENENWRVVFDKEK